MKKIRNSIYAIAILALVASCNNSESTNKHSGHGHETEEHLDHANDTHAHGEMVNQTQEVKKQIAENINAEKFKSLIDEGHGTLLDVRTVGEVANGTINGSTNIDFNSPNFKSEIEKLDREKPVLVFCASGGRSGSAMRMMKDMGFKEVYNLTGGYMAWPYK
ncbi:MAG TPA: rhodanese-like domain-containing protein [Crocinitomix sp.]|nr:rhodanese-like domain-containing protein [Crocinitomix sp.]